MPQNALRPYFLRIAALAVLAASVVALVPRGASADLKEDTSLKFAPADAAFYVSGMRMREVFDKVVASNAFAKLKEVPSVQFAWGMAMMQWQNPQDPNMQMFKQMLADPANQQLVEMLKDAVSSEVFFYADKSVGDAFGLFNEINAAASEAQMEALSTGDFQNMQTYQTRAILGVLEKQGDKLKVPTVVSGMKLTDTQKAMDQLKRLEEKLPQLLQQNAPMLVDRFAREQIAGGEFLTMKLDGSLVPWQMIMQNSQGDEAEMQKLAEKIKPMTMVVSIGVLNDYLMISVSADTTFLTSLGQGSLLYDRDEMAPVRDAADKPITEVAYVSAEFLKQVSAVERQMEQLSTMVKAMAPMMLATAPELQGELIADVDKFVEWVKANIPEPGSYTAYNYLTPEGYESYSYSWASETGLDASQNLSILNHLGGDPIAFYAARGKADPDQMDAFGIFFSRVAYYAEQFALQQLDETQQGIYEKLKADFLPLLVQVGEATRDKLVPAFADSQSALVLDAKSTSDAWHVAMPPAGEKLPMIEVGVVMGVSDANLVKEGFSEYFDIAQQVLDKMHQASTGDLSEMFPGPIPPIKLAKPKQRDIAGGTVYYYILPAESGLDKQIAPNAGLSDKVMVASLLPKFTARLLADTPLQGVGPLANTDRPLARAYQFKFADFLDAIAPWIDYGMNMSMAVSYQQPPMNPMENIPQQVDDVMEVLKCFKGVSGVTYKEGNAMVTHSQWIFKDL